jgi:hypothetical protein
MSRKTIVASFAHEEDLRAAVQAIREGGWGVRQLQLDCHALGLVERDEGEPR